jgi:hypothetical protein
MENKTPFVNTLLSHGRKVYSQTIEDGIIEEIFRNIGTTNKFFVELGAWDGQWLSNTANLRINEGWNGLLVEGSKEKADINPLVTHGMVIAENVNELFDKGNVPEEYDLLSIDIDGNDFWVWKAIDENRFSARVVIVEYNHNFIDQYRSCAAKYRPELDSTIGNIHYYGATLPAFKKLGEAKGYSLIFRINVQNLIFVKTELLHEQDRDIPLSMFLSENGIGEEFDESVYGYDIPPHWNNYANTKMIVQWKQDLDKEWIEI